MKNLANTLIAVLFCIAFLGYGFCSFFIEPKNEQAVLTTDINNNINTGVRLPVIMYHLVLNEKEKLGDYTVSKDEFESDIKYLSKHGYSAVVFSDLKDYVKNIRPLPEKPVMITFDDGYYNNYLYAYPVIKKYNFKWVISPIGKYSEIYSLTDEKNEYYSHLTFDEIKEMTNEKNTEIANHTYDMHTFDEKRKGCKKNIFESMEEYKKYFIEDIEKNRLLFKEKAGCDMTFFTYPYGEKCSESDEIIRSLGYSGSLSCVGGINIITKNPDCLFDLKRYNRQSGKSSGDFFKSISVY